MKSIHVVCLLDGDESFEVSQHETIHHVELMQIDMRLDTKRCNRHHKIYYRTNNQFIYHGALDGETVTFYSDAIIPRQFVKVFSQPICIPVYQIGEAYRIYHRELLTLIEQYLTEMA